MSDPHEQARQAFLQGVAHFEQDRLPEAQAAFEQALRLAPGRPSVLLNLGVTRVRLGHFEQAVPLLQQALAADERQADAWAALGLAQMELGQWPQALQSHLRASDLGAASATHEMRLGQCLAHEARLPEALSAFERAAALEPGLHEAWSHQGHMLREMDRPADAARCYQRALALGADAPLHQYYLSALGQQALVDHAPAAYVQALFDQYAGDFEQHLVGQLGYQGHRRLIECLPAACPPQFGHVLDLGCGTGLCGPLVRPRARRLTGVDLSPAMIEQSRATGAYDALVQADLLQYLAGEPEPADLVLAADVFIYVGRLEPVFEALGRWVRPGGWLAFTVEEASGPDAVQLQASLRYAHALPYLDALAERHGWRRDVLERAPLRLNQAEALMGCYLVLQKRA